MAGGEAPMTIAILDGGMGRELKRMGAPFRQPEWSALALMQAPEFVARAHAAFLAAGAEIATTNSYALVPFHLGEAIFAAQGRTLSERAGRVAREAVTAAGGTVRVAGSLPPLFGSYRPDLFDAARAPALLEVLVGGLDPYVDLWLAETQGSSAEAEAACAALAGDRRPLWLSFTLVDDGADPQRPRLRSGEDVAHAAEAAVRLGAAALLFNCSQPEVMSPALDAAAEALQRLGVALPLGVYANAFGVQRADAQANAEVSTLRADLDPPAYLAWVRDWVARGAAMVGGCCGIGPEHIAALAGALRREALTYPQQDK
jgi:S-methylmethionine-dependent homocysteine/selenocysteine methylase